MLIQKEKIKNNLSYTEPQNANIKDAYTPRIYPFRTNMAT